ncbi:MAG TPA: hypothetical protein VFR86_18455, partial [Burkholderiaceae bacterium]|nr:hypothetical protein [Burkholderiaceae bacterium]
MTTRRRFIGSLAALPALASSSAAAAPAQPAAPAGERVIRYALPAAETGFDPAQISDLYSRYVTAHIFESLLIYDFMARPVRVKPLVAAAMPEVSADFRTYTFRIRP